MTRRATRTRARRRAWILVAIAAVVSAALVAAFLVLVPGGGITRGGDSAAGGGRHEACADIEELGDGYEPLFQVELPERAEWNATNPVPYTHLASDSRRAIERVAYCLETVDESGTSKRVYASFDAFSSDTADYEIPTRSQSVAQPVGNLTVEGDGVTEVTGATGAVQFWPYAYSAGLSAAGDGAGGGTAVPITDEDYGSFQILNREADETVLAVNAWNEGDRALDIGIGDRPTGRSDWTFSGTAASLRSATLSAYVKPAPAPAVDCDAGVSELADYRLLYELDVPETAEPWLDGVDYAVDNSADVDGPVSRVAYCLSGHEGLTPRWSYASMDAWTQDLSRYGIPEDSGDGLRRGVTGLSVRSSTYHGHAAATPADDASGAIEFWPNRYRPAAIDHPEAGGASGDAEDTVVPGLADGGYGSFQVRNATEGETVLALNGWADDRSRPLDVGIGPQTAGHEDWTLSGNRADFTDLRLRVYVAPAGVAIDEGPTDHRLYPRDPETNTATMTVSGTVTDPDILSTRLVVRRDGEIVRTRIARGSTFEFDTTITAGFVRYDVELWAMRRDGARTLIRAAEDIVAGDTYVLQGQSNAVAALWSYTPGFSSTGDASPWIRTFGSAAPFAAEAAADTAWYRAVGDSADPQQAGFIGRLGVRLGAIMMEESGVPVAVFQGGQGGTSSSFFQRTDRDPADGDTNYGRLLQRLRASGLADAVTSIVWMQGESDALRLDARTHRRNVGSLLDDWRVDFPALEQTYVVQVRGGCGRSDADIQEVQRRFGDRPDVTVVSSMGLDNHDGCHFGYEGGYRDLASWISLPMKRDLLGAVVPGPVSPPDVKSVTWANTKRTAIRVSLRDAQTLSCDDGAIADFRLRGTDARVTGLSCDAGAVTLTLDRSGHRGTKLSYVGHLGEVSSESPEIPETPWIANRAGMGLLAFAGHEVR